MLTLLDFLITGSRVWFEFIGDITVKIIVILGFALFFLIIWKRATFAARHLVLHIAIVSILLVPLLTFVLPKWEVSVLPSILPDEVTVSTIGYELKGTSILNSKPNAVPEVSSNSHLKSANKRIHWPVLLLVLWSVGSVAIFARLLTGLIGTKLIVKNASPVEDKVLNQLASYYAKKTRVKRRIRLLQSHKTMVPITCGWLRPAVVVPEEASSWSSKRKEIVMLHEFAHIKRGDFFSTIISYIVSIIYWFNPLVWVAVRQLSYERERASDDFVLAAGTKASEYANHLLEIAKRLSTVKWLSPVGIMIAKKSNLEGRIMSILNNKKPCIKVKPVTLVLICLLAVSFIVPVASLHTWAREEQKQNKTQSSTEVSESEKEAIKKALSKFYELIESLDFANAVCFFKGQSCEKKESILPVAIIIKKKDPEGKHWIIATKDDWKEIDVDSEVLSIEKKNDIYLLKENILVIGTDSKGKRTVILRRPGHLFDFVNIDGKWKINCKLRGLVLGIDEKPKEKRSADADKEESVKKVGIAFTEDGIGCIVLRFGHDGVIHINANDNIIITKPVVSIKKGIFKAAKVKKKK